MQTTGDMNFALIRLCSYRPLAANKDGRIRPLSRYYLNSTAHSSNINYYS